MTADDVRGVSNPPEDGRAAAYEVAHKALATTESTGHWGDAYAAVNALFDSGTVVLAEPLRALHREAQIGGYRYPFCEAGCGMWPCPTARLLNGETNG